LVAARDPSTSQTDGRISLTTDRTQSQQSDVNLDGVYDALALSLAFPMLDGEAVAAVSALLLFDYELQVRESCFCRCRCQSCGIDDGIVGCLPS
jgi:hypothetical protein